jgi:hypothetical protein
MVYDADCHFKELSLVEAAVYGITIEGDVWLLGGKRSTPKVDQNLSPFVTSFGHNQFYSPTIIDNESMEIISLVMLFLM